MPWGAWWQQQKLSPPDGSWGFGTSVDMYSHTLVVGAPYQSLYTYFDQQINDFVTIEIGEGKAFVYYTPYYGLNTPNWVLQATLTPQQPQASSIFGHSVAISTNTIVVGSPKRDIGTNDNQGVAFVFDRTYVNGSAVWNETQMLTAPDGNADNQFGTSVAIDGNYLASSAPTKWLLTTNQFFQGYVYVFKKDNAGTWLYHQTVVDLNGEYGDLFGFNIDLKEDQLLIGIPLDDEGNIFDPQNYEENQGSFFHHQIQLAFQKIY